MECGFFENASEIWNICRIVNQQEIHFTKEVYVYEDELREDRLTRIKTFQDRLKNEGLHSSRKCTQEIVFKDEENERRVSFGKTTVYFF